MIVMNLGGFVNLDRWIKPRAEVRWIDDTFA